jgi:hypothetical protein
MLYQVLARMESESAWEPYQAMTRDPLQALNLVRKASQTFAEVSVLQAATAPLLRDQIRHLSTQQGVIPSASPVPSLTGTPRLRFTPAGVESQRWEMERGPGGDHDVPYRFSGPISAETLHRWARLMAAAHGESGITSTAELADQIRQPSDDEAGELLSDGEPAVARTERAS